MIIKFRENDSWVIFGEIDHIVYKEAFTVDEEKGSDGRDLLKRHCLLFFQGPEAIDDDKDRIFPAAPGAGL